MSESVVACQGVVKGRVQGVGFRYFVLGEALALELFGWVMNQSDASVAFSVEGRAAAVESFLEHVRLGPTLSRVDEVLVQNVEPEGFEDFVIRYE